MCDDFDSVCEGFFKNFGDHRHMVLSTCSDGNVSSRMMCVIQLDGLFYFQTDRTMKKYRQLMENPSVALCADNLQIEGSSRELGHPLAHKAFTECYSRCFNNSFLNYSSLSNERLFVVEPNFIQKWVYEDGVPYVERFDFPLRQYSKIQYVGR